MSEVHWDLVMYIGEGPESGRVVYLDTYRGYDAMRRCRVGFFKYSGMLSALLGEEPMDSTERGGGVHSAVWQKRFGLYGEADVHLCMEDREDEEDNSDLEERGYER